MNWKNATWLRRRPFGIQALIIGWFYVGCILAFFFICWGAYALIQLTGYGDTILTVVAVLVVCSFFAFMIGLEEAHAPIKVNRRHDPEKTGPH